MNIFDFKKLIKVTPEEERDAVVYLSTVGTEPSFNIDPLKLALVFLAIRIKKLEAE